MAEGLARCCRKKHGERRFGGRFIATQEKSGYLGGKTFSSANSVMLSDSPPPPVPSTTTWSQSTLLPSWGRYSSRRNKRCQWATEEAYPSRTQPTLLRYRGSLVKRSNFRRKVAGLAVIGATVGALAGGAAVLCLAHDCLVEGPGETEGLVRTDILLSAASAFITLRRSIRAAAAAAVARGGAGDCGGGGGGDGNLNTAAPAGDADSIDRGDGGPETPTSPGSHQRLASCGTDERGDLDVGVGWGSGPFLDRSSSGTITSTHSSTVAAVAQMEVAVELDVYGDELCADLAEVSAASPSSVVCLSPDDGSSTPPSPQPSEQARQCCRTRRVRRAVEKHSALLSPQSVCALTALLSATGEKWARARHTSSYGNSSGHAIGSSDHGGGGEESTPAGDPTAWKAALSEALLAVRTASLEHLALWAAGCDLGQLGSACVADVLAEVARSSLSPAGNAAMEADARTAAAAVVVGDEDVKQGGACGACDGTESTWAALHKASGVGFSPLSLLAITLLDQDDDHCSGGVSPPLVVCDASTRWSVETGPNGSGDGVMDNRSASREVSSLVASTQSVVRSALRLLSPTSLRNVAQCLSSQRRRSSSEENASASARQAGQSTASTGDSTHLFADSRSPEILDDIPGHPAIGDLSCLDDDTLKRGAEGVMAALDARGIGALPPAVLAVALQSGEAGVRLESLQAQIVLRLAGG